MTYRGGTPVSLAYHVTPAPPPTGVYLLYSYDGSPTGANEYGECVTGAAAPPIILNSTGPWERVGVVQLAYIAQASGELQVSLLNATAFYAHGSCTITVELVGSDIGLLSATYAPVPISNKVKITISD